MREPMKSKGYCERCKYKDSTVCIGCRIEGEYEEEIATNFSEQVDT